LISTIPGIPKVTDFELFGDYLFTSNPPLNNEEFIVDTPENFKISVPKYGSRILVLQ
jgi:hypothetical protein